jgi:acetyl esterase
MIGGEEKLHIAGRTLDLDTKLLAHSNSKGPQLDNMSPVKARKLFQRMTSITKGELNKSIDISELLIPVDENDSHIKIAARLYTPKTLSGKSALMIYFHGGGNVIGDLDSYEVIAADFAAQLNLRTLNVDYRLAPEHKFPTAAKDAYTAYNWARENADTLNINANEIILAGDSAGGYLSSVVSLQALQNKQPLPIGQVLIYPMTDISKERESLQLFAEGLILTKSMMDYFIKHYL